jgi:hypothetical protein
MTAESGHGQPFAPFGSPPLKDEPAILRAHPFEKTMGPAAPPPIGLKGALHDGSNSSAPEPTGTQNLKW